MGDLTNSCLDRIMRSNADAILICSLLCLAFYI